MVTIFAISLENILFTVKKRSWYDVYLKEKVADGRKCSTGFLLQMIRLIWLILGGLKITPLGSDAEKALIQS